MDDHFIDIRKDSASPWPGPRGEKVTLRSDSLDVVAYPEDGARIVSLKAFGQEVLRQWTPQRRGFQYGCFPMVPWVGRVGGGLLYHEGEVHQLDVNRPPHALHGLACFRPWTLTDDQTFVLELADIWPWRGKVEQRLEVNENELAIHLEISTESEAFPASAGWHPWFNRWLSGPSGSEHEAAVLGFDADWQEEAGINQLPTGRRIERQAGPWDNSFGSESGVRATIDWPTLSLVIESQAQWLTVFTEPEDSLCVEPLTGPPNGVNTAPELVTTDTPLRISTYWTFSTRD